ncbi:hypothetical protein BEP19_04335 [Ammoniphilus oxalaticus]|uniref:Bile acid:sodium symporter n=2 Tax=Ammoniphilus oxalaticus TaxID=66863 RepID=A0A419SM63_9BACL|nr:hypothetical protein BEP19_04335 [Ammoniphilus oxalaticus]
MPIFTPLSVVIGILFSDYFTSLPFLIPWVFAIMTFSGGMNSDLKSFGRVIAHPWPILVTFFILHLWMPLVAWGTGKLLFADDPLTMTGLILGMIIPTGVTSFIWVSIYKGNQVLALTIILIDTLLAPLLVPYLLSLFVGKLVMINSLEMMKGLLFMIGLPSLFGMLLNEVSIGAIPQKVGPVLAPFTKVGLNFVVMVNSSAIAPYIFPINKKLLIIAAAVGAIAFIGYLCSRLIGKLLNWKREEIVTLTFCGGMRNITTGAVIAIAYFPYEVSIPVVLAMVFQQVLASLAGRFLRLRPDKGRKATASP